MFSICYYADRTMSDLRELEYKLYGAKTLSICFFVLSSVSSGCSTNIYQQNKIRSFFSIGALSCFPRTLLPRVLCLSAALEGDGRMSFINSHDLW